MEATEFLRDHLRDQIREKGLRPLSSELGVPFGNIRSIVDGRATLTTTLDELCRALGLEFYIGPPRDAVPGESSPAPPVERIPKAITDTLGLPEGANADAVLRAMKSKLADRGTDHAAPVAALDRRTLERTLKSEARALKDDLEAKLDAIAARLPSTPVARLAAEDPLEPGTAPHVPRERIFLPCGADVRAAAGTGEEVFEETEIIIGIPADSFPRSMKLDSAVALRAEGDSMEPTIRSGDFLAIDRDDREPRSGKTYVLRTGTGLVVKRLRQEAGAWIMTSDNAEGYPPRPVGQEDRILGRVIWFGPEKAVVMAGG